MFLIKILLIYNSNIISNIAFIISQLNTQIEFYKIEKYLKICNKKKLKNLKKYIVLKFLLYLLFIIVKNLY